MENLSQPYQFSGKGNYGGKPATAEELVEAYAAAPACHHPGPTIPSIEAADIDPDFRNAAVADSAGSEIDEDWAALNLD